MRILLTAWITENEHLLRYSYYMKNKVWSHMVYRYFILFFACSYIFSSENLYINRSDKHMLSHHCFPVALYMYRRIAKTHPLDGISIRNNLEVGGKNNINFVFKFKKNLHTFTKFWLYIYIYMFCEPRLVSILFIHLYV